jgi:flagellar basal body rod protein FlgF
MKLSAACLLLFAGFASAGKPGLSITLKDGCYGSIKSAVAPVVSLSGETDGVEYGLSVDLNSDNLPKSIWGQKKSSSGGWNLKTRAEMTQGKYDFNGKDSGVYITVQADDSTEETYVWGSAAISTGLVEKLKIGAKKIIDTNGGKLMVAPRYNFEKASGKVVLGFEKEDTDAYLTISNDDKDLLVNQKIDDSNSATFKAGTSGFIAATLTNESELGSTTVTLTSDEVDVEIQNDGWVAGIKSDRNLGNAKPTVRFSKSFDFEI